MWGFFMFTDFCTVLRIKFDPHVRNNVCVQVSCTDGRKKICIK